MMQRPVLLRAATDPRLQHLQRCIAESIEVGGGVVVSDPAPSSLNLAFFDGSTVVDGSGLSAAFYYSPQLPRSEWASELSQFDFVVVTSPDVETAIRDLLGPDADVRLTAPPIRLESFPGEDRPKLWRSYDKGEYRLYTVVPEHEIGVVYPLAKAFLDEYRASDDVTLTIRALGHRDDVQSAVAFATEEIALPVTKQGRIRIVVGPWRHREQLDLAAWGHCCLLPWAGCWFPLEVAYALAAGNFVAAPALSAGGILTPRTGTLLDYTLDPGGFAALDWEQVAAVMRVAVASGSQRRVPAIHAVDEILSKNGHFSGILMANPDTELD